MEIAKTSFLDSVKKYNQIVFIFISAIIIYLIAGSNNDTFLKIMSVNSYLTWHTIFEFASVLVSFSIFTITYFAYEEYGNLNIIILGCAYLLMAFLDTFHTLSYKGMSDFFVVNDTANRATTLWILSRLLGSLGVMISVFIIPNKVINIKKCYFVCTTIAISIALFIIVTFYPDFFPVMFIEGQGLSQLKIFLEYVVIALLTITFIKVSMVHNITNSESDYRFMMALVLLIFSEFAFTNYGSIYDVFNYIGHFFKVLASIILYRSIYIENITSPYRKLKEAQHKLRNYSNNLDLLVEQRTEELEDLNKVLLKDIEYAKEVQFCLLPSQMPQNMSVLFDAKFYIAERLSGDFYNVIKLDDDNIALYIGDVSGHGVAAAMLTVFANQNALQLKEGEYGVGDIIEPGFVLKTIYNSFNKTNISSEKYILMLYGVYNIKDKSFTYSSAGINVPPYIIKNSGEVYEMNVKGLPICKLGDFIKPYYENETIQLDPGDKILFYSDGLVEAMSPQNDVYGEDRLKELLEKNHKLNSVDLNNVIKNDLFNHIGKGESLMDDTTLLVMEIPL